MDDPHERHADELEDQADWLEKGGDRVGDQIKALREDWESKKSSQQAPGAVDAADAAPGGLGAEEEDSDEDSS
jgi:hypothetical protein